MNEKLSDLIMRRGQLKAQVTRLATFLDTFDSSRQSSSELEIRSEKLQPLWHEFDSIQSKIEILDRDSDHEDYRINFENLYFSVMSNLKDIIENQNRLKNASNTIPPSDDNTVPILQQQLEILSLATQNDLKSLSVPIFDGDLKDWQNFYSSFISLVDSKRGLTNSQKFHHLNNSLRGEAKLVIDSINVTDENYTVALDVLKKRFDIKKLIKRAHVAALFELPVLKNETYMGIRSFTDQVNKHLRSLETLGVHTTSWDLLLIHLLSHKLDSVTKRKWETYTAKINDPQWSDFESFLDERCTVLQTLVADEPNNNLTKGRIVLNKRVESRSIHQHLLTSSNSGYTGCAYCKQSHYVYSCQNLLKLPINERIQEVKKMRLCLNCLRGGHLVAECRSSTCKKCKKRHNTILHLDSIQTQNNSDPRTEVQRNLLSQNEYNEHTQVVLPPGRADHGTVNTAVNNNMLTSSSPSLACNNNGNRGLGLLSTAVIRVWDTHGNPVRCRALLDSGSQSNFMSSEFFHRLNLNARKINMPISGIGNVVTKIRNIVDCTFGSLYNGYKRNASFLIIENITGDVPIASFDSTMFDIPSDITLADPSFNISNKVDILIGSGIFWDLLCVGQISRGLNSPVFQKSKLGWIVAGSISILGPRCLSVNQITTNDNLQSQIEKFWLVEEYCSDLAHNHEFSRNELDCEGVFINTTKRDKNGRFVVRLPLCEDVSELGNSEDVAIRRFYSLERKLNKNSEMKFMYQEFIHEYERLGHMTKIDENQISTANVNYYLPHHGVYKQFSSTTKLRVVFDASSKSSTDKSLNDILMVGPTLQDDLFSILLRFRKHNYVMIADIEKMYRQIFIAPEHRDLQRIVWRDSQDQPLSHYRLNTVTYGTASASFLSIRCLFELARKNEISYPQASEVIRSDFYVDDLISGAETIEEARVIKNNVSKILEEGGFLLRKWLSNDSSIINEVQISANSPKYYISDDACVRTLGLLWNASSDIIQIVSTHYIPDKSVTKRGILSVISQIFDPLGLVGPIITRAKIMLQSLWKLQIGWDESVPIDIYTQWKQFCDDLEKLMSLEIPRHVLVRACANIQIHGFGDASEMAYGACVYVRCTDFEGKNYTRLLCSKARVAPLRSLTIPRLELCAALLLAKLVATVLRAIKLTNISEVYYWTDSSIVLCWLNESSRNFKTFVCNRISQIQGLSNVNQWHHVRSLENPADILSRGVTSKILLNADLWWSGPSWLRNDCHTWDLGSEFIKCELPDRRSTVLITSEIIPNEIFSRFSNFNKLQRVLAYCLRFKQNCLSITPSSSYHSRMLSIEELGSSLNTLIRLAQNEYFGDDIDSLKTRNQVRKSSKLSRLNSFIDGNNIIRVGGRLRNAQVISADQKFPIVLPTKHPLTTLIIRHEHQRIGHAGPQATLAAIRYNYWPLHGMSAVKRVLYKCIICFKNKPRNIIPQMGDLPSNRLEITRPFYNVGIDFAGPFFVKDGVTRSRKFVKCYLCIYVCLSTKAVHLELCGNLTTESFLNSMKRFVSRRGICKSIMSDNGTNFQGANRELCEIGDILITVHRDSVLSNYLSNNQIKWHFIPPRSPHLGGIYEAAVKSAKFHLKRIVGKANLTYEGLSTVLVQIEAILNSRPLTPLSISPLDLTPLTPSHFLIGDVLTAIPQGDVSEIQPARLSYYQRLQQLVQHFWKRWKSEYISSMQHRNKWKFKSPMTPKIGSMVLLKDENTPPLNWPVGRITQLHPGGDGVTRVVSVKVSNGIVKRSVTKLCLLPVDDD